MASCFRSAAYDAYKSNEYSTHEEAATVNKHVCGISDEAQWVAAYSIKEFFEHKCEIGKKIYEEVSGMWFANDSL